MPSDSVLRLHSNRQPGLEAFRFRQIVERGKRNPQWLHDRYQRVSAMILKRRMLREARGLR